MKLRTRDTIRAVALAVVGVACLIPTAVQAQTGSFTFSQSRPRLVVLLHGVTPKPQEDEEAMINTPAHGRGYWGFDFIKALQGKSEESEMRVVRPRILGALNMEPHITDDEWFPGNHVPFSGDYAPICFPVSWWTSLPAGIETNTSIIKDYIKIMINSRPGADTTMVMVPWRDGSKHLMPQLGSTIDQVYMSYQIAFGHLDAAKQPQIYLVAHSFGGIIARGILAAPTGGDLWGYKLTANQIARAKFIRDRVVLVNTLASPHEGTWMPDFTGDAVDFINTYGTAFCMAYYSVIGAFPWNGYSADTIKKKTAGTIDDILAAVSGKRDSLDEVFRVEQYNTGILHPSTAKRSNGQAVPIFTMAGRNPGGMYFDASRSVFWAGGTEYNPLSTLDMIFGYDGHAKNALALKTIDHGVHLWGYGKEGKRPWGTADEVEGDKVMSPYAGMGPLAAKSLASGLKVTEMDVQSIAGHIYGTGHYQMFKSDGEYDTDGFLAWDSAHGLNIPANNFFRVYDESQYGSWLPWDIDNHDTIRFNPGNGAWIHNELIRDAGPLVASYPTRRSVWGVNDVPSTPHKTIKIEVLEVHDIGDDLDFWNDADFSIRVRAGGMEETRKLPNNTQTVKNLTPYYLNYYSSTVIPIKIDVWERDGSDIPSTPDDLCSVSPTKSMTSLYLYFDTRTNRILVGNYFGYGGQAGDTLTFKPQSDVYNNVSLKLRITQS